MVNAATYSPGVTPGAWISIFGTGLANTTASIATADLVNGGLPTTFQGTSVTINGKPAFLQYASPTQINIQAPAETLTGPVQVSVTTTEGTATTTAIASATMPGVFTLGAYAAAVRPVDRTIINGTGSAASGYTTAASARPGDVLELYATGLGATTTGVQPGTVFTGAYPTTSTPTVTIGGTVAPVAFAGLVGAGLYQINITVPSTLSTGSHQVILTQDGIPSPPMALLNVTPVTTPATSVSLTSSAPAATAGVPVTLTATVTPASSTGTITFYEGSVPVGTGTLASGTATLSAALSPGIHAITAVSGSGDTAAASLATVIAVTPADASPNCSLMTGTAQVLCLANAFVGTLSTAQRTTVQLSFTLQNVTRWSNLPVGIVARNGLRFGDLSSTQLAAAFALLQAALSAEGIERLQQVRGADEVIAPLNTMFQWGAGNYYISFYGTPSATTPWILQISGHHYALNHIFNGRYSSGSPYFIGTEPVFYTVHGTTYSPMEKQRAAMFALNQVLLANSSGRLSGTFDDVVVGPDQGGGGPGGGTGTVNFPRSYPTGTTNRGVLASTLPAAQQALIRKAIEAWVSDLDPATATELLGIYEENTAIANTYVGFSGSGSMTTVGDYIRIDGPRVWVELVVQSAVAYRNSYHYHSIWRDKVADYGGEFSSQ